MLQLVLILLIHFSQLWFFIYSNDQQASMRVETIQSELAAIKVEVRDASTGVVRVDALCARKEELVELRDRVAGVEPFLDQVCYTTL